MDAFYGNPVYPNSFPDPFVLKHRGEYWAYGTGAWRDGRWFGVLRSPDLARWEEVGGAMEPLPGSWPCLWAPEVSYHNGRFYLYYSLGDETTMQLRVAVADHPAGPFVDSGRRLSHEPFAIDAHVFVDDDGARHLFYATDYLEHSHVGTGTARVRLQDPLTPVGESTPVTRARYDWQVYHPSRPEKGGVRWHTIEGSFVLKHKGRYYQMFSGGNWQDPSYGVSYALTDRIDTPDEWSQVADGQGVLPILRTLPGRVIGPGHNSAVRGPNNRELFCVYHRWASDLSGRVMAIDRLDWAGERMLLIGPNTTPQPVLPPTVAAQFGEPQAGDLGPMWDCAGGAWSAGDGEALQQAVATATATCTRQAASYLAEVSLRAVEAPGDGAYGVALGDSIRVLIQPGRARALASLRQGESWTESELPLPPDFAAGAYHLLRVEVNAGRVAVRLDEATFHWAAALPADTPLPFALHTVGAAAAFSGFALTEGWEDSFFPEEGAPAALGWQGQGWRIAGGALSTEGGSAPLGKGPLPDAYELVLTLRLPEGEERRAGFYPAAGAGGSGPLVAVERAGSGWALLIHGQGAHQALDLPPTFDPTSFQQLRAVVRAGTLSLSWEGHLLATTAAPAGATHVALWAAGPAAFDLVRVTAIP